MRLRLIDRLKHVVDLQLPGFEKAVPAGTVGQLAFSRRSAKEWYAEFVNTVQISVGRHYLPLYRMADGEFIFCLGRKPDLPPRGLTNGARLWLWAKNKARTAVRNYTMCETTLWGEQYSQVSRQALMRRYIDSLQTITKCGMLALHFTRSPGCFSEQYIEPLCSWFEDNEIAVTPENYTSFYFVYALLCGPDNRALFKNRRVLAITSGGHGKCQRIEEFLCKLGASDVQFGLISSNQSMLDKVELSRFKMPIDVALVAAGIGSANILEQLKPLNTVCIDAGICMEIYADLFMRKRIFTIPDNLL